jgi:biopolymer transport protein ExbD
MAEMDTSSGGGHKKGPGVKKGKKLSTRVDLTPMVDLGFLLITFFIFTTTMSQPTGMRLYLPKDVDKPDEQNKVKESAVITLMPSKDDMVYYYEGLDPSKIQTSTFKKNAIRDVILDKKRRTDPKDFMVVIKPTKDATYKNTVDILDEMTIDVVKRYALVDITPDEYKFVAATEQANGIK